MRDYHFEERSDNPHYYVFHKKQDDWQPQSDSVFYRYDTIEEAVALFQYLQIEHPSHPVSLGVHKDEARRADIIARINGVTVLSDDFKRTPPWKNDPVIMNAAKEASKRLNATWKIDRNLVNAPILIPNEPESAGYVPWYLKERVLCPKKPGNAKTSILEANVEGIGWMSLGSIREMAKSQGYGNPEMPMVGEYLVAYEVGSNGFSGSMAISPSEFRVLEKQYLAKEKESLNAGCQSLDALKEKAQERAEKRSAGRFGKRINRRAEHSL